MKLFFKYLLFFLLLTNITYAQVNYEDDKNIPERPNPPKLVNDFAHLFPDYNKFQLENKLVAYNDSTSTQIVVVTVENLNGYAEDDYSLRLGRKWGVGQKGKNNGIIILISKEERAVNIELGYGIESYISDRDAKQMIEYIMIPKFRGGDYFGGVDSTVNVMISMLQGTYNPSEIAQEDDSNFWVFVVIFGIFALIFLLAYFAPPSSGGGSGGSYTGGSGGWRSTSSWGSGGSSWSGGGGSSGGFGGFGGGSFGGGGASGKW